MFRLVPFIQSVIDTFLNITVPWPSVGKPVKVDILLETRRLVGTRPPCHESGVSPVRDGESKVDIGLSYYLFLLRGSLFSVPVTPLTYSSHRGPFVVAPHYLPMGTQDRDEVVTHRVPIPSLNEQKNQYRMT